MKIILEIISLQTASLTLADQAILAMALLAPACGLIVGLTFFLSSRGILRWSISWSAPLLWLVSMLGLLSQVPAKENMLLITTTMMVIPVTLLYYAILFILSLGALKDTILKPKQKNSKNTNQIIVPTVPTNRAHPLPSSVVGIQNLNS